MTTGQWGTNRCAADIGAGAWVTLPSDSLRIGLLVAPQPAAADTQAEIQQMNFVSDLTVTAGAVECTASGYSRVVIPRGTITEDDVNNWAAYPTTADPSWPSIGGLVNQQIIGHFVYTEGSGSDTTRPLWVVRWYAPADLYTTNGSSFSVRMVIPFRLAVV